MRSLKVVIGRDVLFEFFHYSEFELHYSNFVRNLILQGTARNPLVNNYNNRHNVRRSTMHCSIRWPNDVCL